MSTMIFTRSFLMQEIPSKRNMNVNVINGVLYIMYIMCDYVFILRVFQNIGPTSISQL